VTESRCDNGSLMLIVCPSRAATYDLKPASDRREVLAEAN
jgi:hypothetical protein